MIYVFLTDGFEETEALVPVDMLRRAGFKTYTVGVGGKTVVGAHGIEVVADLADNEVSTVGLEGIVLPGGPGVKGLDKSITVDAFIKYARDHDLVIGAICAAPMLIGLRGVLIKKDYTCYPGYEDYAKRGNYFPSNCITDGRIVTARGAGTALEFALAVVDLIAEQRGMQPSGSRICSEKIARDIQCFHQIRI